MSSSFVGFSIVAILGLLVGQSSGQIAIKDTSFSIRSTIRRESDGQRPNWIEVEESYSHEQRRARLNYRIKLSDDLNTPTATRFRGSFTYDSAKQTGTLMDLVCTKTSPEEIETTLGLYLPKDSEGIADYIVGPAKLLFFIDKHRNKLALSNIKEVMKVRNMPSLMYDYSYQDPTTGKVVKFHIFFSELSRAVDKEKSLPIEVVMSVDDAVIIVDFWEPELILPSAPKYMRRFESFNEYSSADTFSYRLASGCSEALQDSREQLFKSDDPNSLRQFSFRARIKSHAITDPIGPSGELFVAYDKGVNSIRVDSLTRGSTSVFSLNLNRAYHVRDNSDARTTNQFIGKPDGSLETVSSTPQTECTVSNVYYHTMSKVDEKRFSLGKILLGSDEFVYMGRGQVHGINAVIYEANNVALPYWLAREIPYDNKGKSMCRDPIRGLSGALEQDAIDVVAYFDEMDDEHRLLLVDVNHFDRERTRMFGKMTIAIDDFVWKIDNQSPSGEKASEMFSLADECSLVTRGGDFRNRYGQVNLLLESTDDLSEPDSLLSVVSLRDVSLLAALQDRYRLPASMVYDLETQLKRHRDPLGFHGSEITQLHVSFRVAEHSEELAMLEFVGLGSRKSRLTLGDGVLPVQSFEDCFIEAARREGTNINFGFRHSDNICLLDTEALKVLRQATVDNNNNKNAEVTRILESKPDTVELFRVVREKKSKFSGKNAPNYPELMKELQMVHLFGVDRAREKVSFKLKGVHLDRMDRESPFSDEKLGSSELENRVSDARKTGAIDGLGLLQDDLSRRIGTEDDEVYAMNEERCHAACLADAGCKLYSVCVTNLETNCIVSKLDLTKYLTEIIEIKMKEDQAEHKIVPKLTIKLGDPSRQLELTKHPNCKIRLKNHLDLFVKPVDLLQNFGRRRIYAVEDVSRCAERATLRNIKTLQTDTERLPEAQAQLSASDFSEAATNLERSQLKDMQTMVHGFFYFDKTVYLSTSQNVRDFITKQLEQLDGIKNLDSIEGFCFMNGLPNEEEKGDLKRIDDANLVAKVGSLNIMMSYAYYSFMFEIFYEKHHGTRLVSGMMSASEHEAFMKFSGLEADSLVTEMDSRLMKSYLERGENIQAAIPADVDRCAELCFSQEKGPWPGCRSFDYVRVNTPSGEYMHSLCFLNSITLKQAFDNQRYDLVFDKPEADSLVIHYEPKPGFARNEVELSYDLRLLDSLSHIFHATVRVQAFGIFCVFVVSLFGGLALGLVGSTRYLNFRQLERQKREESLVSGPTQGRVIEFDNQVDADGLVRVY